MITAFITWDVSPEIFSIGSFAIRWYGLFFALSFYLGYLIVQKIFKNENIAVEALDSLTIYMALGTILGARFGHVLFYQPDYYLKHPIEILKIWEGGLASHGAAVGILFSLWLFARKMKKGYLWILDRMVIVIALAGFFIRMGNLANSEIYGHETSLPWGFLFIRDNSSVPCHPTQIYEGFFCLALFLFLFKYYWKKFPNIKDGVMFSIFLIALFSSRFLFEFLKNTQVDFEQNMLINMGQILSLPFVLIGIVLLWRISKSK